ncbi:hypothetical protein HK101_006588, partial [Irineochytrium annulatum]
LQLCGRDCPYVVRLHDHFCDHNVSLAVMEMAGTEWTPANLLLRHDTHEGLRFSRSASTSTNSVSSSQSSASSSGSGSSGSGSGRQASRRVNIRDLYACLKAHTDLPDGVARHVFRQVVECVAHFHVRVGVSHGDLKLQNFLIDEKYGIKVVDLSAVRFVKDGPVKSFLGTPMFGAPETAHGTFDGRKNDVWALGIILYMLYFGVEGEPEFSDMHHITFPPRRAIASDCRNLIRTLLERDPARRPSIEDVSRHPYVLGTRLRMN